MPLPIHQETLIITPASFLLQPTIIPARREARMTLNLVFYGHFTAIIGLPFGHVDGFFGQVGARSYVQFVFIVEGIFALLHHGVAAGHGDVFLRAAYHE